MGTSDTWAIAIPTDLLNIHPDVQELAASSPRPLSGRLLPRRSMCSATGEMITFWRTGWEPYSFIPTTDSARLWLTTSEDRIPKGPGPGNYWRRSSRYWKTAI